MIKKGLKIKELENSLQAENDTLQQDIERIIQDYRNKAHSDIDEMYLQLEKAHEHSKLETMNLSQENHRLRLLALEMKLELLKEAYIKNTDAAVQSVIEEVFRYGNS